MSPAQVYVGNLMPGLITNDMLRQLFNSTMAAAFPDKIVAGASVGGEGATGMLFRVCTCECALWLGSLLYLA